MQFRRWSVLLTAAACGLLGTSVAARVFLATSRRYTSTSTIEIRADDRATWPDPAAVASLAFNDQALASLIEKNGLYPNEHRTRSKADVIHRFRESITVQLTSTAPEARDGTEQFGDGQNTVLLRDQGALQVSFTYPDKHKAQEVAEDLVGLFIEENLRRAQEAGMEGTGKDGMHNHA
jgi:hypothetical protein